MNQIYITIKANADDAYFYHDRFDMLKFGTDEMSAVERANLRLDALEDYLDSYVQRELRKLMLYEQLHQALRRSPFFNKAGMLNHMVSV